jgi:putative ABC transport system permease protein
VGTRDAALRAFSETAATHMRITSGFLLPFAAVIACGIVYNHARLSLSERERDFARRRVIGDLPREVSAIFLGEIAALTLLALPLGALLGRGLAGLVVDGLQTELYHLDLVVLPSSYATGVLAVAAAAAARLAGLARAAAPRRGGPRRARPSRGSSRTRGADARA